MLAKQQEEDCWEHCVRASMSRQLFLFLRGIHLESPHAIHRHTGEAFLVIVIKDLSLVIFVVLASSSIAQATTGTTSTGTIDAIEQVLIGVNVGKFIGATSLDGGGGVGNEVVSEMGKGVCHVVEGEASDADI